MRALWIGLEKLDRALFAGSKRMERLANRAEFRERVEESIKDVRPPQKAIQFDN